MTRPRSPRRRGCPPLAALAAVSLFSAAAARADLAGQPAGVAANPQVAPAGVPAFADSAAAPAAAPPATAPAAGVATAGATPPATPSPAADIDRREIRRNRGETAAGGAASTRPAGDAAPPSLAPTMDLGRVALALSAVLGLILFLRWGSRKLIHPSLAGGSPHLMQVVARTPLAPRQQLLLVRVGQRLMVIGDSGGRLTGVGQIDDPDEVAALVGKSRPVAAAAAAAPATSFGGVFRRLSQTFGKRDPQDAWDDEDDGTTATATLAARSERRRLLDTLAPHADPSPDTGPTPDTDPTLADEPAAGLAFRPEDEFSAVVRRDGRRGTGADSAASTSRPAAYSEADAEAAVEAARADILALRTRLREVTDRMGGQAEAGDAAAADPGPGPDGNRRPAGPQRRDDEVEDPEA